MLLRDNWPWLWDICIQFIIMWTLKQSRHLPGKGVPNIMRLCMCHPRVLSLQQLVSASSVWHMGSFDHPPWGLLSWHHCKGTGWEVVHNVGHCTSGSPSSSGAVNTKTVTFVPISTLLTSLIRWSLASDVASCLVPIAWLLKCMSFCSAINCPVACCPAICLLCNLLVSLVEVCMPLVWTWLSHSILRWHHLQVFWLANQNSLGWHYCGVGMTSCLGLMIRELGHDCVVIWLWCEVSSLQSSCIWLINCRAISCSDNYSQWLIIEVGGLHYASKALITLSPISQSLNSCEVNNI